MRRSNRKQAFTFIALAAAACLPLASCTPRYDQDFDAFRQGQTTAGGNATTLPRTTLPRTTLPRGENGKTTLPAGRTTLPREE